MPVTIDQVDVDVSTAPVSQNAGSSSPANKAKPDPREVQKEMERQAARRSRVRAD